MTCSKCEAESGDDWSQCGGRCPMPGSPHYSRLEHARQQHGFGLHQAARAVEIADQRFDGDIVLGGWFIHAAALAINVRTDRDAWNEAYARRRAAEEAADAAAS